MRDTYRKRGVESADKKRVCAGYLKLEARLMLGEKMRLKLN
jgi:hypothetical protein